MAKQQKTHWFLTLTLIVLGALFIGLLSYKSGRDSVQTEAQQAVNNVREEAEEIIGELKEEQEEEKVVGYDAATKTMSFPELLLIFDEDWDYGGTDEKWSIEPKLREANLFYFGETREDVEQKQSEQAYYQPATLSVMQTEAIEDWEELGTYLEEIELENRAELTVENFSQECDVNLSMTSMSWNMVLRRSR